MKIEEEIYKVLIKHSVDFDAYINISDFIINKVIPTVEGEVSAKHYDVLRRLIDSINNVGHEDRRSGDIDLINKSMYEISDKYEDFLP